MMPRRRREHSEQVVFLRGSCPDDGVGYSVTMRSTPIGCNTRAAHDRKVLLLLVEVHGDQAKVDLRPQGRCNTDSKV